MLYFGEGAGLAFIAAGLETRNIPAVRSLLYGTISNQ